MLTLVSLCFLSGWMLPADSMVVTFNFSVQPTNQAIQLSMAEDSVDDMYYGCHKEMSEKVQKYYLKKENQDRVFAKAWSDAAQCAKKKPRVEDRALTILHMHAICVYTRNGLYHVFNEAVRAQRRFYNTKFKFHSLHFLLTSAIQILKSDNRCYTTYRRTKQTFTGHVNQRVRFGTFASSSYRKDLYKFGDQTCFKIKTCYGAYVGRYSAFPAEQEVLIPPYEAFRVTNKMNGLHAYRKLERCKLVYELESEGFLSTLNCKAITL